MSDDSQTQMLQEMGFSKEQALEALKASDNDLNKAIAFLFGEVDASAGAGTQDSPLRLDSSPAQKEASINISNPHEVPEFLGSYATNVSMDEVNHYERPVSEDSMSHSLESLVSNDIHIKENVKDSSGSQFSSVSSSSSQDMEPQDPFADDADYPENIKTEFTNRPVILGKDSGIRCWVPILSVLAQSTVFATLVLESEADSSFVKEVQRIVFFIRNFENSKRWYHDTTTLASVLQAGGPKGLLHDEELVLNMVEFIMQKEPALRPTFESMVHSLEDDFNKELSVLEIEGDPISSTLYECLNELFWQRDFELLGRIQYSSVAPIVMYQLVADGSSSYAPFQLSETFYPEIYSDKALEHVQVEIASIKRAQMAYQTSNRKLMDLNFFEGKKINGFLSQAAAALQEANPNASEDIRGLAEKLEGCRINEQENQQRARDEASPRKLAMYEGVIENMPELRPYSLIGVVFSESEYFVKTKDAWVEMDAGVTVGFDHVKETVQKCRGSSVITLIYVDEKTDESVPLDIPEITEDEVEESPSPLISLGENTGDNEETGKIEENEIGDNEVSGESGETQKDGKSETRSKGTIAEKSGNAPTDTRLADAKNTQGESGSVSPNKSEDAAVLSAGPAKSGLSAEEGVKRPRWEDQAQNEAQNEAPGDDAKITKPAKKYISVRRDTVRQFLEDEKIAQIPKISKSPENEESSKSSPGAAP